MGRENQHQITAVISDQSQLKSLQSFLGTTVPEVKVTRVAGQAATGELGMLDVLTIIASSSGLVAAIKVLPEFLKSRRSGLSITMTVKGEKFTLQATNIDEVTPILEKLLDG